MSSGVHVGLPNMLIIAGYLEVSSTERDAYVQDCVTAVQMALTAPGCLDYSITADSVDPARVRIYERWESEEHLHVFRGSGPSDSQQAAIVAADVMRYGVASVSEP
jgi:quinol monooxygenase YgiN